MKVQAMQVHKSGNNESYENLGNAIILLAVKDYRGALKRLHQHPNNESAKSTKNEVERFFHSPLYSLITGIDADMLIRKLNQEVE